MIYTALVICLQ